MWLKKALENGTLQGRTASHKPLKIQRKRRLVEFLERLHTRHNQVFPPAPLVMCFVSFWFCPPPPRLGFLVASPERRLELPPVCGRRCF